MAHGQSRKPTSPSPLPANTLAAAAWRSFQELGVWNPSVRGSTEEILLRIAQYYDVPLVSFKNAMLAEDLQMTPGYSYEDFAESWRVAGGAGERQGPLANPPSVAPAGVWFARAGGEAGRAGAEGASVSAAGTGRTPWATACWRTRCSGCSTPRCPSRTRRVRLHVSLVIANAMVLVCVLSCLRQTVFAPASSPAAQCPLGSFEDQPMAPLDALPPPLVKGNDEAASKQLACLAGGHWGPPDAVEAQGFALRDSGNEAGYWAETAGATLRVKLGKAGERAGKFVGVSYERAPKGMGKALVACAGSCGCDSHTLEGHADGEKEIVTHAQLRLHGDGGEDCVVEFTAETARTPVPLSPPCALVPSALLRRAR